MRTYPILRDDDHLLAFEITSVWITFHSLHKLLRSIEGVTDVRRNIWNDDRFTFSYRGVSCVVHEPWGDSSRYWIGPKIPEEIALDIRPLHEAFHSYRGVFAQLWAELRAGAGA